MFICSPVRNALIALNVEMLILPSFKADETKAATPEEGAVRLKVAKKAIVLALLSESAPMTVA
jgi:hypothetical protein